MYKRDLVTAEIQKLAQALARIIGLKLEGKKEESDFWFADTLENEFELPYSGLLAISDEEFEFFLKDKSFSAEKLELLSKLLYTQIDHFDNTNDFQVIAKKLLTLYQFIEKEHHTQSFEGLSRQKQIKGFLENI
ncbi:hypothetical protein [Pedobacter punctiformis]|uniref:Uncharacterized protein n=1 Tax=Pedobacter punctiformis TaxID=3004097 RepID=A0ABT4LBX8_9SPHI|nr:hypothetical protein [Pedobacter sp. HCMS5-2]MCZ4245430.1 hypothetical protein [Pedobacter sp. HCMS5-2]